MSLEFESTLDSGAVHGVVESVCLSATVLGRKNDVGLP